LFWAAVLQHPRPITCLVVVVGVVVVLLALLLPSVQSVRETARSNSCMNNLKHIGLAIEAHKLQTGVMPAAATHDGQGVALQSWRTAILPYLDQQQLFSAIRQKEPWNSLANLRVTGATSVEIYQCPAHYDRAAALTHYFAVVGDRTAWPADRGRSEREFRDNKGLTLLILEAPDRQTKWAEPEDMTFDEAVKYLSESPAKREAMHEAYHGFFQKPSWTINAVFADASVRRLRLPLPREVAIALLTVDGGEKIDEADLDAWTKPELDYGRCYAFGAFVALALLPGVRLFRKAKLKNDTAETSC
jgi:type II secretory pathway pseudopilin PulG